jgi:hypothetical protein
MSQQAVSADIIPNSAVIEYFRSLKILGSLSNFKIQNSFKKFIAFRHCRD